MKISGNDVRFDNGKILYANGGIIGLGPDLMVSEGFDGEFFWPGKEMADEEPTLTPDECVELAEFMIAAWTQFKQKHSK